MDFSFKDVNRIYNETTEDEKEFLSLLQIQGIRKEVLFQMRLPAN
jgi:hypothetical protein